ncbi:DUF3570 domain-containing protein [Pelagicoccus sp. SDUM812003]|uniref:DUF3570 domain-containing protein n=1 Tax=Pelagicoccus sp. SDUM812003 TaxID=3041267 RepID=UPI00280FD12A|nr:DUF3570 domain-containing protein [Pelagicoccus sp. SDUM812003]MDQ8205088.1 DUF3570 domain-containing protein [Pelagicoccus sp. SDUM812003]
MQLEATCIPHRSMLSRALLLGLTLQLASPRSARAEDRLEYKWQDYAEDDGRIRVKSHYLFAQKEINTFTTARFQGVVDAIAGATPTGVPADEDSGELPLSDLVEEREAGAFSLEYRPGETILGFEYARSDEDDYLSNSYTIRYSRYLNKRNTTLRTAYSFIDDDITPPAIDPQKKESHEFLFGIAQLLDPKTTLSIDLTYSDIDGYLTDPYKQVLKDIEIVNGLTLPLIFAERRPEKRERYIFQTNAKRYFDTLDASLDATYRFFDDNWDIESHTLDLAWYQKLGEKWTLRPHLRYYRQSAAEFYSPDLNQTDIIPESSPGPDTPFYSSDYRLSSLSSLTYGLKAIYQLSEWATLDLNFERYDMSGEDELTSPQAYPDASIFTVGVSISK